MDPPATQCRLSTFETAVTSWKHFTVCRRDDADNSISNKQKARFLKRNTLAKRQHMKWMRELIQRGLLECVVVDSWCDAYYGMACTSRKSFQISILFTITYTKMQCTSKDWSCSCTRHHPGFGMRGTQDDLIKQ